jgi:hypothetical protein
MKPTIFHLVPSQVWLELYPPPLPATRVISVVRLVKHRDNDTLASDFRIIEVTKDVGALYWL